MDGVPIVDVAGGVGLDNVGRFKAVLQEASTQARRGVVVLSLAQTRYFDSQRLRALLQIAQRLTTMRFALLLVVGADGPLRPVLRAMNVPALLPVFDLLTDAITAARVRES